MGSWNCGTQRLVRGGRDVRRAREKGNLDVEFGVSIDDMSLHLELYIGCRSGVGVQMATEKDGLDP